MSLYSEALHYARGYADCSAQRGWGNFTDRDCKQFAMAYDHEAQQVERRYEDLAIESAYYAWLISNGKTIDGVALKRRLSVQRRDGEAMEAFHQRIVDTVPLHALPTHLVAQ